MTITQSRTLEEQIAHENALIDSWITENDYNSITDLGDIDEEEGLNYDEDDFDDDFSRDYEEECFDDGDWSQD